MHCGAIFAADAEAEHYSGVSVVARIEHTMCPECGSALAQTLKPYPDSFRVSDGSVAHFEPDRHYPPDSESITKEVWDIYS